MVEIKDQSFRAGRWKNRRSTFLFVILFLYVLPRFLAWGAVGEMVSEKILMGGFFSYLFGGLIALFLVLLAPYLCIFVAMYAAVTIWNWNIILAILVFSYPLIFLFYGFDIGVSGSAFFSNKIKKLTER